MSENTESKMLERFNTLIGAVTPMGAAYNPPGTIAVLTAMAAKSAEAQAILDALNEKEAEETSARTERRELFAPLADRGSDVYRYCKALGWSDADLAHVQSKVREIRGARADGGSGKPEDDPATPGIDESEAAGSASQTSYASLEGHWSELVAFLIEKGYKANEEEFKLAALVNYRDQLRAANIAVANADGAAAQLREQRDQIFYLAPDSIYNSARASKNYLSAVHEDSQVWQTVKDLEFNLPRRLR